MGLKKGSKNGIKSGIFQNEKWCNFAEIWIWCQNSKFARGNRLRAYVLIDYLSEKFEFFGLLKCILDLVSIFLACQRRHGNKHMNLGVSWVIIHKILETLDQMNFWINCRSTLTFVHVKSIRAVELLFLEFSHDSSPENVSERKQNIFGF